MSDAKTAKLIYDQWHAAFTEMDKSKEHYYDNFYTLFSEMKRVDIPFDIAYSHLKDAIVRHYPSTSTVKYVWKNSPSISRHSTEIDFLEEWKNLIKSKAYSAFHDLYPLKTESGEGKEDSELPKAISREEYNKQRKHANSFPILDLNSLKKPYNDAKDEDFSLEDLEK